MVDTQRQQGINSHSPLVNKTRNRRWIIIPLQFLKSGGGARFCNLSHALLTPATTLYHTRVCVYVCVWGSKMAGDRLMLSTLKTGVACSLDNNVSRNKCLIHVKLTDFCNKTVENLIESEKVHT